ncbi:MAG: aryl-sulfate sulfotransferase, partial [Planctomycetaceae bacterium]
MLRTRVPSAATGLALVLCACAVAVGQTQPFQPRFLKPPTIRANPNRAVPLAAIVRFVADRPVSVSLKISDGKRVRTILFPGRPQQKQRLIVLGFKPARTHAIQIVLHDGKGKSFEVEETLSFTTGKLPADFPPLTCPISKPAKMEPGITLFNCFQWVNDVANEGLGYIIAIDSAGEVVWYCRTDHPISDVKRLRNGDLIYLRQHRVHPWTEAVQIDMLGNVVRDWYAAARVEPGSGPANAVPLNVDTLHHDVVEVAGGNLRAITTEVRRLRRYPSSAINRKARRGPANVVGDVIVEFEPGGKIVQR